METIHINPTESTPEVVLDFEQNSFRISGESYPENVVKFYEEIFDALKTHLSSLQEASFTATFELIYFNSSSVKVIMNLFDMFEECAANGNKVQIVWCYQDDDETIEEFGEEFSEDLEHVQFRMKRV